MNPMIWRLAEFRQEYKIRRFFALNTIFCKMGRIHNCHFDIRNRQRIIHRFEIHLNFGHTIVETKDFPYKCFEKIL